MTEHPGLGEPTDITPEDALEQADAPPPATSSAEAMDDAGLGTGDGADPQPAPSG